MARLLIQFPTKLCSKKHIYTQIDSRGQWLTPTFHSERAPPHHRHPPLRPPRNNGCLQSASASLKLQIRNYLFASGTLPKRRSVPRPGSATPATVDPNPKRRRRRPSRHCSRVRWPRFPHLAPMPHPSRHWLRIRLDESAFRLISRPHAPPTAPAPQRLLQLASRAPVQGAQCLAYKGRAAQHTRHPLTSQNSRRAGAQRSRERSRVRGKPVDSSVNNGLKHPHPDVDPTPQ